MRAPRATVGAPFGASQPRPAAATAPVVESAEDATTTTTVVESDHQVVGHEAGPSSLVATRPLAPRAPLELTGGRRDDAKLLVGWRSGGRLVEGRMADIGQFLEPGDVLLVNNSTTRPAALVVDDELVVHLSTELGEGVWVVELRHLAGNGSTPWLDFVPDGPIALPGGGQLTLLAPYTVAGHPTGGPVRLWTATLWTPRRLDEHLARYGRPIRYGADAGDWPLDAYQTVFASEAGSAEMPSAARGFTAELVTQLVSQGITVAPITLHTGVASQEAGETPYPERFEVPEPTAAAVNHAKATGHRVIAVGTTATRAIETVADPDGRVRRGRSESDQSRRSRDHVRAGAGSGWTDQSRRSRDHVWVGAGSGWTDLVVTPQRGVHVVDGLLTGWHDPEASHLFLVEAVAGRDLLDRSYATAVERDFRGHEFGDFHLTLP
jgi:S-adenosylmethionine:tRNA ribosyltransferase-isomerase